MGAKKEVPHGLLGPSGVSLLLPRCSSTLLLPPLEHSLALTPPRILPFIAHCRLHIGCLMLSGSLRLPQSQSQPSEVTHHSADGGIQPRWRPGRHGRASGGAPLLFRLNWAETGLSAGAVPDALGSGHGSGEFYDSSCGPGTPVEAVVAWPWAPRIAEPGPRPQASGSQWHRWPAFTSLEKRDSGIPIQPTF